VHGINLAYKAKLEGTLKAKNTKKLVEKKKSLEETFCK